MRARAIYLRDDRIIELVEAERLRRHLESTAATARCLILERLEQLAENQVGAGATDAPAPAAPKE
jgi:hypothetical protein